MPGVWAFDVERPGRGPLLVLWDHRDAFAGEDEPEVSVGVSWQAETATITDAFGAASTVRGDNGQLQLQVSVTPLFVE
jgi:hypothetical protein